MDTQASPRTNTIPNKRAQSRMRISREGGEPDNSQVLYCRAYPPRSLCNNSHGKTFQQYLQQTTPAGAAFAGIQFLCVMC